MKIAIMGIRGIPAKYGGFETLAEQLAPRLVKKRHEVTVYGRSNVIDHTQKSYNGVKLVILPTISQKYLDTPVHTFLSVLHSLFHHYDVVLICNAANSVFSLIPRLVGQKVVVNVDGIERRRKKWGWVGKSWYLIGEMLSCVFPNKIITDAHAIEQYYLKTYHKKGTTIPYGYNAEKVFTKHFLDHSGLKPNEYILFVARLEPENNAHVVIEAFKKVHTSKKLVIVGDAPYASSYKEYVFDLAKNDKRIILTGYVFGEGYRELQCNAYCYVHAGEVGGTPPALVEAMGFGNCVIGNGTPENEEVLAGTGLIYKKNNIEDLRDKIQFVIENSELIAEFGRKASERAHSYYNWERVTEQYEELFLSLI